MKGAWVDSFGHCLELLSVSKYPIIPGISVIVKNIKSEKENPWTPPNPSNMKVNVATDSLKPNPENVMGIFPSIMITGNVMTAVQSTPKDSKIKHPIR